MKIIMSALINCVNGINGILCLLWIHMEIASGNWIFIPPYNSLQIGCTQFHVIPTAPQRPRFSFFFVVVSSKDDFCWTLYKFLLKLLGVSNNQSTRLFHSPSLSAASLKFMNNAIRIARKALINNSGCDRWIFCGPFHPSLYHPLNWIYY